MAENTEKKTGGTSRRPVRRSAQVGGIRTTDRDRCRAQVRWRCRRVDLNPRVWLAMARSDAEPLIEALSTAVRLPEGGQWVSFLRNHDELDLSRLTDEQRGDVFRAFAPRPEMRLYGRGIRRRLAPML